MQRYNKDYLKKGGISSTKKIVGTAVFSACAFVVSLLEFTIFPSASFLKLDFSNVFVLLGGFIYGPISAILISLCKELLCLLKSSSGGIGELANFLITISFVIVPTVVYRFKKGLPIVITTIIIGCLLQIATSLIANKFILLPFYMEDTAKAFFESCWYFILLFNLIKSVVISIIVIVCYKKTSYLIKKI